MSRSASNCPGLFNKVENKNVIMKEMTQAQKERNYRHRNHPAKARYRLTHKEYYAERQNVYALKNPIKVRSAQRTWRARVKKATYILLGGKCIKCGFADSRALQIDHVNGGGWKEIKTIKGSYALFVLNSLLAGEKNKYQLLCANCNWIKRVENNEVRKKP